MDERTKGHMNNKRLFFYSTPSDKREKRARMKVTLTNPNPHQIKRAPQCKPEERTCKHNKTSQRRKFLSKTERFTMEKRIENIVTYILYEVNDGRHLERKF